MHTDRGSEYPSGEFRRELRELSLRQGMGRTGICYAATGPRPQALACPQQVTSRRGP